MIRQALPVLLDRAGRYDGQIHGRTPYMQAVHVEGPQDLIGREAMVKINHVGMNSLRGDLVMDFA